MSTPPKSLRISLWIFLTILVALTIFSLTPLPRGSAKNCGVVEGNIESVMAGGGPADILVKISGHNGHYYINRGLENGIDLDVLKGQLKDRSAKVYYVKHWSLLNFSSKTRHIARIETDRSVVYNEWKESQ